MNLKLSAIGSLSIVGLAALLLVPGLADAKGSRHYKVTISNLTAGQPLTPPVLVTHSDRTDLFTLGEEASPEIQAIAENGNSLPLLTALAGDSGVHDVVEASAPLIPANNPAGIPFESTATFIIEARGKAEFLSYVSMLICTNDGFTGLDSVELPKKKLTLFTVAYDARTEHNTEDLADMVPPCQGLIGVSSGEPGTGMSDPMLAEDGVVIPHVGIIGGADLLPEVHGWSDPVAKVVIERVRHRGDHDDDDDDDDDHDD
jgi:hypothetical protein